MHLLLCTSIHINVMQEIYAALIMYNYCTRIIGAAEVPEKEQAVYAYQVNFKMAVYL